MQIVSVGGWMADLRRTDEQTILGMVERAFEEPPMIRQQLARTMPRVREMALSVFEGAKGGDILCSTNLLVGTPKPELIE
jgi:hypothetical protein